MTEVTAPVARRPVRGGIARSAAALLLLLAGAGCGVVDAPAHALEGEGPAAAPAGPDEPVDAACALAERVVDDALGVDAEPAGEPMSELLPDGEADGCRLTAVGSFADLPEEVETPVDLLWDSFEESGWREDPRYASDTDETSALGMWKSGVLCLMGAVWEAPGEYHEDHAPADDELRYDVMVECAPTAAPPIPSTGLKA